MSEPDDPDGTVKVSLQGDKSGIDQTLAANKKSSQNNTISQIPAAWDPNLKTFTVQRPERGEISPEDREAIRERSAEIGRKLEALNPKRAASKVAASEASSSAYGQAFKFAAELVVGVVVGGGIGWALDKQLGTAPWLMVVFVVLGFAAGLLNVVRAAQELQNEPLKRAAPSVKDDVDECDGGESLAEPVCAGRHSASRA